MSDTPTPTPTPRPLEQPIETGEPRLDAFARLLAVVDRLRAPDGCPWDREQTVQSLAPSLVEEAHELVEAIETADEAGTIEESGDLMMVVLLIARVAQDEGRFDLGDAARAVADKLIRRHPHVFAGAEGGSSEEVLANWERIKATERSEKSSGRGAGGVDASALAGVPRAMPALQRAHRVGAKALSAGFRWADAEGALAKVAEELDELRAAWAAGDRGAMEAELGDLCLAAAFVGNYLKLDPERAARASLRRFEQRFRAMEASLGPAAREATLAQWLAAWRAAKAGPG